MPLPPDSKVAPPSTSAIPESNSPNLAVLEAVKFSASSTAESAVQRGPDQAVAGASFWEAASPPPGWWSVELESPRAVQRLSFSIFDGVLDPAAFQLQALTDEEDEESWITIFTAEEEKGCRGDEKIYSFENERAFRRYRLLIERTMGGPETETHPFLQGVGLFEEGPEQQM